MNADKKTGRIIGFLFLLTTFIGGSSLDIRGLSGALTQSPDFLQQVFQSSVQMKIAILMDLLANGIGLGVAVFLFPLLTRYHKGIAMGYLSLWITQFGIIAFSNVSHLSLLSLSEEFVNAAVTNVDYFNILGTIRVQEYFWAHFLSLMVFTTGAAMLYYFFFKARLIPRLLSLWGIVAVTIVFVTTLFQVFDQPVNMILYLQNGVHILVLTFWLLIKGFNTTEEVPSSDFRFERSN